MSRKGTLSENEIQALNECVTEAFFSRSLPLMALCGGGTYMALRAGKLNAHPKWGSTPKVLLACTIAYFIGQISYEGVCRQKLMNIPDSKVGDMIRKQELGVPFSSDEMRVLQECNRESFYQRCLPLSTVFGVGTYMGVKSGYLNPNPRFGAVPKVISAVVIGYLMGKISYQGKCAEKLMSLPDSKIGALLRNRRFGSSQNSLVLEDQDLEKVLTDIPESEKYSDISNKSIMDLDTDRPLSSGFDDFRPNLDDIQLNDAGPSLDRRSTSYDELRRRNREEYEQKRTKPYRGVVMPEEVPTGLSPSDMAPINKPSNPPNIYGDMWEK